MLRRKFRTEHARKRERLRTLLRIVLFVAFTVLALFGLYALMVWEEARIHDVVVQTKGVIPSERIEDVALSALRETHAFFVPNDTILFTGASRVADAIRVAFPRVEEVTIRRAGLNTMSIHITERTPRALWCGDVVPVIASADVTRREQATNDAWGTCYLLDHDGFLYAKAPLYTGTLFVRYYGSLEKAEPVGQHMMPVEEYYTIQSFADELTLLDMRPIAILFVDEEDAELYLEQDVRVLISRSHNLETIKDRLFATLEQGVIDTEKTLEYLDLRFGNKAYIRYVEDGSDSNTSQ